MPATYEITKLNAISKVVIFVKFMNKIIFISVFLFIWNYSPYPTFRILHITFVSWDKMHVYKQTVLQPRLHLHRYYNRQDENNGLSLYIIDDYIFL